MPGTGLGPRTQGEWFLVVASKELSLGRWEMDMVITTWWKIAKVLTETVQSLWRMRKESPGKIKETKWSCTDSGVNRKKPQTREEKGVDRSNREGRTWARSSYSGWLESRMPDREGRKQSRQEAGAWSWRFPYYPGNSRTFPVNTGEPGRPFI